MSDNQAENEKVDLSDDLDPEYDFDYSKAKPNRFANSFGALVHTVVLDDDVAAAFPTAESVNSALRGLIAAKAKPTAG